MIYCVKAVKYLAGQLTTIVLEKSSSHVDFELRFSLPQVQGKECFHENEFNQETWRGILSNVPWSKVAIFGDGHPTFNRNPYNGYIGAPTIGLMSFYPLLYGNNGSLEFRPWHKVFYKTERTMTQLRLWKFIVIPQSWCHLIWWSGCIEQVLKSYAVMSSHTFCEIVAFSCCTKSPQKTALRMHLIILLSYSEDLA